MKQPDRAWRYLLVPCAEAPMDHITLSGVDGDCGLVRITLHYEPDDPDDDDHADPIDTSVVLSYQHVQIVIEWLANQLCERDRMLELSRGTT